MPQPSQSENKTPLTPQVLNKQGKISNEENPSKTPLPIHENHQRHIDNAETSQSDDQPQQKRKIDSEESASEPPLKKVKPNPSTIRGRFRLRKKGEKPARPPSPPARMRPVPKPMPIPEPVKESENIGALGWHEVVLSCVVKQKMSMFSGRVKSLSKADKVHVVERVGKRARIDPPVDGWCSFESQNGSKILTPHS
eukprot:UN02402